MNATTISDATRNAVESPAPHSPEDLATIATRHSQLTWTMAVTILAAFVLIPFVPRIVSAGTIILFEVFSMKTAFQLARRINKSPLGWASLMIVPLINLFATIRLTHLAAVKLRSYGIKCCDLGVSRHEVQKYGSPNEKSPVTVWKSKNNS